MTSFGEKVPIAICFLAAMLPLSVFFIPWETHAPTHIPDGPQCFMAENPPAVPTAPLPPPAPPLPALWDEGTPEQVAAVNDIIWYYASDPQLVAAVIHVESRGRIRAKSHVGARGLMQLMPRTAEAQAVISDLEYYDGIEYVPQWNVRVGIEYLEYLLRRYKNNYEHALTAYNRGPYNTDSILRTYGELPDRVKASYSDLVLQEVK
jgi:soluble lytic murein transglycosylase-like protein